MWGYSHEAKTACFDAAFFWTLNQVSWVPNADGELLASGLVMVDSLVRVVTKVSHADNWCKQIQIGSRRFWINMPATLQRIAA